MFWDQILIPLPHHQLSSALSLMLLWLLEVGGVRIHKNRKNLHWWNPAVTSPPQPLVVFNTQLEIWGQKWVLLSISFPSPSWKLEIFCHVMGKTIYPSSKAVGEQRIIWLVRCWLINVFCKLCHAWISCPTLIDCKLHGYPDMLLQTPLTPCGFFKYGH